MFFVVGVDGEIAPTLLDVGTCGGLDCHRLKFDIIVIWVALHLCVCHKLDCSYFLRSYGARYVSLSLRTT